MKKEYVKPKVFIETGYLMQTISSCSTSITFSTSSGCANNLALDEAAELDRWMQLGLFNEGKCAFVPNDDTIFNNDKICYFTSASNQVFGS